MHITTSPCLACLLLPTRLEPNWDISRIKTIKLSQGASTFQLLPAATERAAAAKKIVTIIIIVMWNVLKSHWHTERVLSYVFSCKANAIFMWRRWGGGKVEMKTFKSISLAASAFRCFPLPSSAAETMSSLPHFFPSSKKCVLMPLHRLSLFYDISEVLRRNEQTSCCVEI